MAGGLVQIPVNIDRSKDSPLQEQLADGIRELIVQDAIRPGMRLPATRALSHQLNVSRNTVKIAFNNLMSEGYLESNGTSGTFVCAVLPDLEINTLSPDLASQQIERVEATAPIHNRSPMFPTKSSSDLYDLRLGCMDPTFAPERTWRRLMLNHLPYRARHAKQGDIAGIEVLREGIANTVSPLRGMSVNPDNCFIVGEGYRAIDLVINVMLTPGDTVAVEDPCDAGIIFLLQKRGIKYLSITVDEDGLDVSSLPTENIKLVFVTPTHQQPLGVTMSNQRRQDLLNWAEHSNTHIVEWDTFGEFCYNDAPLPSVYSMDVKDRVIYINTFANWIGSDLSLGYMVAPNELIGRIRGVKEFIDPATPWLDQRITADFILSDGFFGHLRRVRQAYKQRRDAMLSAIETSFGKQELFGSNAGRHIVWKLPKGFPPILDLQSQAVEGQVYLQTMYDDYCCMKPKLCLHDPNRTILVGYTSLQEERIFESINRLAEIWSYKKKVF